MGNLFSKTPEKSQPQSPSAVPTSTIIELDSSLVSNTSKLNHVPLEAPLGALYAEWEHSHTLNGKTRNNIVNAFLTAYNCHVPLVLRADDILLAISQVVTTYVNQNSEALRSKLVSHDGKKSLTVMLPRPDWSQFISEMAKLVDANSSTELSKLLRSSFTTTTPVARTVSDLAVMSTFKAYFEYTFILCCGIPSVILEGSVDDWTELRERYKAIKRELPGLQWWYKFFDRVLDLLVDCKVRGFATSEDRLVWQKCITLQPQGSGGGRLLCGWVHLFTPFTSQGKPLYGDDFEYTALDPDYTPKLNGWSAPLHDFSNGWREIAASTFDVDVEFQDTITGAKQDLRVTAGATGHHVSSAGVRVSHGYSIYPL
jgi:hypothetical protein